MDRSKKLKRSARRWQVIGILAFVIGTVLIWERVSYNMHDFYAENFDVPSANVTATYAFTESQKEHLTQAIAKMEAADYWEAISDLQLIKDQGGEAVQVAEWYKILCHIGLEEKEEAKRLLVYYLEQPDFRYKKAEAEALLKNY